MTAKLKNSQPVDPTESDSLSRLTIGERLRLVFSERYFEHRPLAEFTSTSLGGVTEYLVIAESTDDLIEAARLASHFRLPFVVIGGGSGVLASDVGYPGVVIINRTERIIFDTTTSQVVADSGVMSDRLVNIAVSKGLGGVEFLAAIPGTIGGAAATNATFNNHSIKSSIKELMLFVPDNGEGQIVTVTNQELSVDPYQPLFSPAMIRPPVILTVRLQMARIDQPEILRRLLRFRQERQSLLGGKRLGNVFLQLLKDFSFRRSDLLRLKAGGVMIEPKDLDIIVRQHDKATAQDIRRFITAVKTFVHDHGLPLDERVHFLGYYPSEEEDTQTSP